MRASPGQGKRALRAGSPARPRYPYAINPNEFFESIFATLKKCFVPVSCRRQLFEERLRRGG